MKIGVLDLQGGVFEHIDHLKKLNVEVLRIKKPSQLKEISGLILPGGESTTIGKILRKMNLLDPIKEEILKGMPVWGTCAGMILLADKIQDEEDAYLKVMNIKVKRNSYGSQLDSFETYSKINNISSKKIPLIFIRAPQVIEIGDKIKVLCKLDDKIVAVKENNMLATSFHPELSDDLEFHKYFLSMCRVK